MTTKEFKNLVLKNIEESKKAIVLLPKVYELLKKYAGKKIGDKTKEKINNELKEKYNCTYYISDNELTIIPHKNNYSYCVYYKYYIGYQLSFWDNENKFVLPDLQEFKSYNKYIDFINNNINVDSYINDLESTYNNIIKLNNQLSDEMKKMGSVLYSALYNENHLYSFETFLDNMAANNRIR